MEKSNMKRKTPKKLTKKKTSKKVPKITKKKKRNPSKYTKQGLFWTCDECHRLSENKSDIVHARSCSKYDKVKSDRESLRLKHPINKIPEYMEGDEWSDAVIELTRRNRKNPCFCK